MKLAFQRKLLPHYLLVLSLFLGNFVYQYIALSVIFLWILGTNRLRFRSSLFVQWPMILFLWALISYSVNLLTVQADSWTMIFWMFSYFPPFVFAWLIFFDKQHLDFRPIYKFYKGIVYFQTFLLLISAVRHGTLVVGDPATGTVGDANWVAFHICIVLIYDLVWFIDQSKRGLLTVQSRRRLVIEMVYMSFVLIIPESTANLGLLLIIVAIMIFREYIRERLNVIAIVLILLSGAVVVYFARDSFAFQRLETAVVSIVKDDIEDNPNLFKLKMYALVFSGKVFLVANPIVGSGPATFTSRSSVIRMPEERTNDFPLALPYFKSEAFRMFVAPTYASWRASRESYGNFASPQTQVISVTVELGLVGLIIFSMFFISVFKMLNPRGYDPQQVYLAKFGSYLALFFVFNLFHLNFWEYPAMSFTFLLFVFVIIKEELSRRRQG